MGMGGRDITPEKVVELTRQALKGPVRADSAGESAVGGGDVMTRPVLQRELMSPGNLACPGCGASLAMRYALNALGPRTMVIMPAGCWSTFVGIYPHTCLAVPVMSVAFETAAATAGGVKAGLEAQGIDDVTVMAWAGDGGTF